MKKYKCSVCGWIYDPAAGDPKHGIVPGTPFEELPADWHCPRCGAPKEMPAAVFFGRAQALFAASTARS